MDRHVLTGIDLAFGGPAQNQQEGREDDRACAQQVQVQRSR
jgi:hypothetical protein